MFITTQHGLMTNTEWWVKMRMEGDSIILEGVPEGGEAWVLVVAVLPPAESKALFSDLNHAILSRKAFDVGAWEYDPGSDEVV